MKFLRTLAAASIAAVSIHAHAVAVPTDGTWFEFDFGAPGSALFDLMSGDTSFTFSSRQNLVLRAIDPGFSGDRFSFSINGVNLGLTSVPVLQGSAEDPVFDPTAAWADARFSRGEWSLAAGTYQLTGIAVLSPLDGGFGYLSVTAVPEPRSYAMLLAGLGVIGAIARRRSSR